MPPIALSAVVLSQNEGKNLPRCLKSLQFADEIVVVDALSEDDSVRIAKAHGARVVSRTWMGFAKQWQFALDQAEGKWVFLCAADEEVPEHLASEIKRIIGDVPPCEGYRVPRRSQFLGEWMLHGPWARDSQVRLFLKEAGTIADRSVHEGVLIDGKIGNLTVPLNHYTHQTLSESITRLNSYTSLEAQDRINRRRIGAVDFLIPPLGVFFKYYISKGCWRAGLRGFLLAAITAIYKSVLYIKIFFLQRQNKVEG